MPINGYAATYTKVQVQSTQSKEDILLLLFEEAIRRSRHAKEGIEANNPKERGENISRALAIISELDCSLDRTLETEMVENLSGLYQFMIHQLTQANFKNDASALESVIAILKDLHEAFHQAAAQTRKSGDQNHPAPAPAERKAEGGLCVAV